MPRISGKPYPGGNFMPRNRFGLLHGVQNLAQNSGRLLHGWQNLARDSVWTFPRWEFYARDLVWTFARGAKPSPEFWQTFARYAMKQTGFSLGLCRGCNEDSGVQIMHVFVNFQYYGIFLQVGGVFQLARQTRERSRIPSFHAWLHSHPSTPS